MFKKKFIAIVSSILFVYSCAVPTTSDISGVKNDNTNEIKKAEIISMSIETVNPSDNWGEGNSFYLEKGLNEKLIAIAKFSDGKISNDVDWESSNPKIVEVDKAGNIKALSDGEAIIKAISKQNSDKSTTIKILIMKTPVKDIEERSSIKIIVKDIKGTILKDVNFEAQLASDNSIIKLEYIKFENDNYIISNLPLKEINLKISKPVFGSKTILVKPVSNLTGSNDYQLVVIIGS